MAISVLLRFVKYPGCTYLKGIKQVSQIISVPRYRNLNSIVLDVATQVQQTQTGPSYCIVSDCHQICYRKGYFSSKNMQRW